MRVERECGQCTSCCQIIPVVGVAKKANQRCPHQRRKRGCVLYHSRPIECAIWACRWLTGDLPEDIPRPDLSGFIVDACLDYVGLQRPCELQRTNVAVLQIWADKRRPEAWRHPSLMQYLDENQIAGLVRTNSAEGLCIFPPSMAADHQWWELRNGITEPEHTLENVMGELRRF